MFVHMQLHTLTLAHSGHQAKWKAGGDGPIFPSKQSLLICLQSLGIHSTEGGNVQLSITSVIVLL